MISLKVSEFGQIADGKVDLKPLTIFVGPNNSGKSYFAILAYAIFRSLPRALGFALLWWRRVLLRSQRQLAGFGDILPAELLEDKEILKLVGQLAARSKGGETNILFRDLPEKVKGILEKTLKSLTSELVANFASELQRCYSTDVLELTRKGGKKGFDISLTQTTPPLYLKMSCFEGSPRLV